MKPHYLAREPGLATPLVALAGNVLLLLFVGTQLHTAGSRLNVLVDQNAGVGSQSTQLVLSETGTALLNGSPMATTQELEFHLGAVAANGTRVSVQVPSNIPTQRLTEVLQACTHVGLTDVVLRVGNAPVGQSKDQAVPGS